MVQKEQDSKTSIQLLVSSFAVIAGIFVMLSMINNITGRVIGDSGYVKILDLVIVFWGGLLIVAGIWIFRRKDFHKSIFEE